MVKDLVTHVSIRFVWRALNEKQCRSVALLKWHFTFQGPDTYFVSVMQYYTSMVNRAQVSQASLKTTFDYTTGNVCFSCYDKNAMHVHLVHLFLMKEMQQVCFINLQHYAWAVFCGITFFIAKCI